MRLWLGIGSGVVLGLFGSAALAAPVTSDELLNAQDNPAEWLMYGRDYRNQRFSPLDQITPDNVAALRPVWAFSTGGSLAGLEATPLFRDGVLYISTDYSRVFAIDAASGTVRWHFEPVYEEGIETKLCCGPVNRGVALKDELVFVNTLDAKLYALNRSDGSVAWQQTIGDWHAAITATGAPLVVGDKVIVGIGGAEYGVRGYLTAYDAASGELAWRTYTIPGPGEPGNESWPGDTWQTGGATTWQTGAYDAETDTLFWGTGNPGPWNSDLRKGDNLWSSSLLALDPQTGAIKWGYQYTPNDAWDYDGNNAPILLDVEVDGRPVKAAVVSNRNGFFYVLDRTSGEFVYAVPTVDGINWTTGLDPKDGRPVVDEAFRPISGGETIEPIVPGLEGGTNWFPMAYNPDLGYVFFATNHWAMGLTAWPPEEVKYVAGDPYMGVDYQMYRLDENIGYIKAFDVAKKAFAWEVPSPLPLFSGMLATKGGLVFTGDQLGFIQALDAQSGEVLWKFQTGSGLNASPITYELEGVQYIAMLSGLGGDPSFYFHGPKGGMLWVFALENQSVEPTGSNPVPIEGALPSFEQ
jgi:alcohol dehydrogenase (cytochrome c)